MEGNRIEPCVDRQSGLSKKILSYLLISNEFFENLSFSWRSWFALWADSTAAVHIKDVIKGLCVPVFLSASRTLHAKQGDVFLITPRRHANKQRTTEHITRTPHTTIKGHRAIDSVMQFLKT